MIKQFTKEQMAFLREKLDEYHQNGYLVTNEDWRRIDSFIDWLEEDSLPDIKETPHA